MELGNSKGVMEGETIMGLKKVETGTHDLQSLDFLLQAGIYGSDTGEPSRPAFSRLTIFEPGRATMRFPHTVSSRQMLSHLEVFKVKPRVVFVLF